MPRTHIVRQADFSGGAMQAEAERRDQLEQMRAAVRTARNVRVEALCNFKQRPGKRPFAKTEKRTETVITTDQKRWRISFGEGTVTVYSRRGVVQATNSGYPWTADQIGLISFTIVNNNVYIAFDDSGIKQLKYRQDTGDWSFRDFAFSIGQDNEIRAPYYRFTETKGITMTPSNTTGNITLTFSDSVDLYVGQYLRYLNNEVIIKSLPSGSPATTATATVTQTLPGTQDVTVISAKTYKPGQIAKGSVSGVESTVVSIAGAVVTVQLSKGGLGYDTGIQDHLVTVTASSKILSTSGTEGNPAASVQWDEIAFGKNRGWPHSILFDRRRLVFCDMPALPQAMAESSVDDFHDFYPGGDPADAIFELLPSACRVLHMMGGPDQFCFTDKGTYYIPISDATPLAPGSVEFILISSDPVGTVRPTTTPDGLVFINQDLNRVLAIVQTGAVAKPYGIIDIGEYASDQFRTPVCLASAPGGSDFPEKYIYIVNSDGTCAVGRAEVRNRWVGWVTWDGDTSIRWLSTAPGEVVFTTEYTSSLYMMEYQDDSITLDGFLDILNHPVPMNAPAGLGPVWFLAGRTVTIMNGTQILGVRDVDASGNIIALPGDDWVTNGGQVGLPYQMEIEPFLPNIPEGTPLGQTYNPRKVNWAAIRAIHSTGFTCMKRTIPAVSFGEDGGQPPVLKDNVYRFRQLGRSANPTFTVTKDTPGPLSILEISMEVSV